MQTIFDSFSDDLKKLLTESKLQIGSVLRFRVTNTQPPKIKRLIITGFSKDKISVATAYINTEINPNIFSNSYLKSLHVKLEEADRAYLDHDSYVDCSQIHEMNYANLEQFLNNDPSCHIGMLENTDLIKIKHKISIASTINNKMKNKYGLTFKVVQQDSSETSSEEEQPS